MPVTRRDLLKAAGSAGLAVGLDGILPIPGLRLAFAAEPAPRSLLVVLHLRGGCDGLNLISPASDPDFIEARASDIRVAADGAEAGHALKNGPAPQIDFRLHRAAGGLAELYDSGHLAFIHAAGLPAETRSHFVAIDMLERGVGDAAMLSQTASGWLARHLQSLPAGSRTSVTAAISAGAAPSGEFAAWPPALSVTDLANGLGAPGGKAVDSVLQRLYQTAPGDVGAAGRATLAAMHGIDDRLARDPQGKVLPYQPGAGIAYEPAADLARPLRTIAQLAKMEIGLEVATVDLGGWDTHEGQAGRFRNLVDRLSNGLSIFYADMAPMQDRLIVLLQTEFGRRLRSNRSGGTDHGRGTVMAVLGGRVAGGRFYGGWPGMASDQLEEGVDLRVATDYRQVITETLRARLGQAPDASPNASLDANLFPGFQAAPPLGLFRTA